LPTGVTGASPHDEHYFRTCSLADRAQAASI